MNEDHLGFRVAYDGSAFSGFQTQVNHKSVQDAIESSFSTVLGFQGRIHFSSRTDTGVHALDQWIMIPHGYSIWSSMPEAKKKRLRVSLNAVLKDRCVIWKAMRIKKDFRTKSDVEWKEYHYHIAEGPVCLPLVRKTHWWIKRSLDFDRMTRALRDIEGEHDFRTFANRAKVYKGRSTVRKMFISDISERSHPFGRPHRLLVIRFRASGFLYQMIRNLVGTVVEIGRGADLQMKELLERRDRSFAGIGAPPHGLVLFKTHVSKKWFRTIDW